MDDNLKTLSNGAVYDMSKGRIVANPGGGTHAITSDNAHAMLARRKAVGLRSQLAGLAQAKGIDPSDIDDTLLEQAGDAVQALTRHMAEKFLASDSLRGMSDAYDKLVAPLVGDRREKQDDVPPNESVSVLVLIQQWAAERQVVDGTVIDTPKSDDFDNKQLSQP